MLQNHTRSADSSMMNITEKNLAYLIHDTDKLHGNWGRGYLGNMAQLAIVH